MVQFVWGATHVCVVPFANLEACEIVWVCVCVFLAQPWLLLILTGDTNENPNTLPNPDPNANSAPNPIRSMTLTLTLTGNPNNNPNPDPDRNHKRSTTWKSKGRPKRRCKREGVICHCSRLVYRCQLLDHHSHTHKRAAHIYLHYHTRSRTHILPHAYTYSPPCTYKPYNHTHTHTVAHMYVQRCGIMVEPGAHPHKTLGGPFTHAHSHTNTYIHPYTHV